jgi:hypothetical protein
MSRFRRHLGTLAAVWLVFQAASLSALLPGECCAAHGEAQAAEECHRAAGAGGDEACPMAGATGQPCPVHAAHAEHQVPVSNDADCVMRGTCSAPAAALASLFSTPGVVENRTWTLVESSAPFVSSIRAVALPPSLLLDTPPPRV